MESSFERAHEFIPERWTSKSEMIRDKRAWAPFSQGKAFSHLQIAETSDLIRISSQGVGVAWAKA